MFSILIVDDNVSDREGIRDLVHWHTLGIEVAGLAQNGIEGYEKAMAMKPDFILTDVAMPLMDGLKMAENIKAELPEVKFIFMSCFDDFRFVKDAMKVDAYGYVLKPIEISELTQTLVKMIDVKTEEIQKDTLQEELTKQIKLSLPLLREHFFRDVLSGKLVNEVEMYERMTYLGLMQSGKLFNILFIQIDNYNMLYSSLKIEQKYLLLHGLKKYILELLLLNNTGYIIAEQHNNIALIVFPQHDNEEDALADILADLSKFKQVVKEKLGGVNVTVGVGEFSQKLTEMTRIYERAEYAVKSKFYSEGDRIIMSSQVKRLEDTMEFDMQVLKKKLYEVLENDSSNTVTFMEDFYRPGEHFSEAYVKTLAFSIVNIIQIGLIEKNQSLRDVFGSDISIWEKLHKFETIVDIKQWLINIIDMVKKHSANFETGRYKKIVEDIKSIVDEKYADVDNIEEIVSSLYISASHANLIFKQQTGKTIFEHLIWKRMEVAKLMLKDPYIKIYEIADRVGYKSKSYFGTVFKEYTGVTPKQFSEKYK